MANTTNTRNTCAECAFFRDGFCVKTNQQTRAILYACGRFMTPQQLAAEVEQKRKAMVEKEEQRLNFILTAMMIAATSTQMFLEYFDMQFKDRWAESDWRFKRAQAAKEICRATDRIRTLYQHNFMADQTQVMTAHGTEPFDAEAFDSHEADGRYWSLLLCHQLDTCWQDPEAEADVLKQYEERPHMGIFAPKDFKHFTTKR